MQKMVNVTSVALFFLAAGIFTSVSILSGFQILFTLSAIYFTYIAIKEKNYQIPKSAYWLIAFMVVALISTFINIDLIPKPSKNFGRIKYFLYGVTGILVFRYWVKLASDRVKFWIVRMFFISICVAGLYAIYRYIQGAIILKTDTRARPLTETMRYGYGSGMILLSILSGILHHEKISKWFDRRLAIAALVIGFTGMFLTFTRGALLGFLVGLPFVFYYFNRKVAIIGGVVISIIVGGLAAFYFFGSTDSKSFRFISTSNNESSQIRSSQWKAAQIAIKERPVLGWGYSNFHTQLARIKNDYDLPAKNYNDAHAHNLFLEIGAGTGLIGLLIFIGWVLTWAWNSIKSNQLVASMVVPFGVAFVVSSQFEVTFDANNASMIFILYSISAAFSYEK